MFFEVDPPNLPCARRAFDWGPARSVYGTAAWLTHAMLTVAGATGWAVAGGWAWQGQPIALTVRGVGLSANDSLALVLQDGGQPIALGQTRGGRGHLMSILAYNYNFLKIVSF